MQTGSVIKAKIVLLGDQSVGKTSVINRFIFDNFTGNEQPTVGVDFVSKTVNVDNKTIRMQLWDTAGQQRFHSLIPSYIKDCSAAIIVFDLTNPTSFNNLGKWIDNVRQVRGEQALIMVLGNKSDLKGQAQQNIASIAESKMKQVGLTYMQVSAKTGHNIKQFFKQLSYVISGGNKKSREQVPKVSESASKPIENKSVSLSTAAHKETKNKKKGCC